MVLRHLRCFALISCGFPSSDPLRPPAGGVEEYVSWLMQEGNLAFPSEGFVASYGLAVIDRASVTLELVLLDQPGSPPLRSPPSPSYPPFPPFPPGIPPPFPPPSVPASPPPPLMPSPPAPKKPAGPPVPAAPLALQSSAPPVPEAKEIVVASAPVQELQIIDVLPPDIVLRGGPVVVVNVRQAYHDQGMVVHGCQPYDMRLQLPTRLLG